MPGRLRGHRCSETPLDSSAETGGERAARVGSCRIYLLRSVHRAYLRVDLPQPEDGQRLREAMRHRGGFRLRGDDAAYGETVGPCVRVSRQSLEGAFSEVRVWRTRLAHEGAAASLTCASRRSVLSPPDYPAGPPLERSTSFRRSQVGAEST